MGTPSAEPAPKFTAVQIICGTALLFAGILTFPFEAMPLGPQGIDSGWQWVVNAASEQGWVFGRDVVFTYGPLGWLASPQDVGHHLVVANGFRIALQALLMVSVLMLYADNRRPVPVLVFSVLWIVAGVVGLRFEGFVFLVVALLMIVAHKTGRAWPAVTAGLIAGITPLIKASLGITTAATLLVAAVLIRKHRKDTTGLLTATAWALSLVIQAALHFPSLAVFQSWIMQTVEVVGGYSTAASIVGPQRVLIVGSFLFFAAIVVGAVLSARFQGFGLTALVLAPSLAITFRLAFVRQDGHQFLFVPFLVALIAVAALETTRRTALGLLAGGLAAVVIATATGALPFAPAALPKLAVTGHRGPANIFKLLNLGHTRMLLAATSRRNLEALNIPKTWIESINASTSGVTVIPWELMYAPANNLSFSPLRTMQLYSAYSEELDQLTAQGLSGANAPDFILDDFAPVGKRRALLDAPATWRTVFLGYRPTRSAQDRPLLLLRRRARPLEYRWLELAAATLQVGGPGVVVPPSPHMVFAEIDAPLNLLGRLNKAFFRVPLLMAVFHRIDGTQSSTRLIPATAGAGILVNHYPDLFDDYAGLWSGRLPVVVSRLQVTGPGAAYFSRTFKIQWRALEVVTEPAE